MCFIAVALGFLTSCTSITKLFPKQPRPFQEREFNSEQWKNGDYQTRGEMLPSKLFQQIYEIKGNKKEKVLELLGKPDEITEAICCYSGRGGKSQNKVELWLYYIEIEEGAGKKKFISESLEDLF